MAWYPHVRGCCGLGGGLSACLGLPRLLCVGGGDYPDPGQGAGGRPAALDPLRQAEHGQSKVVARPPRGDLGQGSGWGFFPRLEDAPEVFVWGGWVPYCPW